MKLSFYKRNSGKINSVIYMAAQIVSLVFAFLINVIMTNYCGDTDTYGLYKYATNFILMIPALFSMGITWSCASLIAKDNQEGKNGIATVSVTYTIIIGVVITLGLCIIAGVTSKFGITYFDNLKIVFPFITAYLVQKLVNQLYTGSGQAIKLSLYGLAPNTMIFIGMFIYKMVYGSLNYTFTILLYLISNTMIIVPKLFSLHYDFSHFKRDSKILLNDVMKSGFKVHLSSIFTTSSTQIIALACGNIYGYAEYGYYSLAMSLATIFQLIGSSLAVVNFKYYANAQRIAKRDFYFMLAIGGTAYAAMFFLIDIVFYWFYPKTYEPTIFYLKVLCLSNLIYGFSTLFNRFFIGKGLGGKVMKNSFITAIATVVINIPMIKLFGMKGMAVSAIIVSIVCLGSYVIDYRKYQINYGKDK
jgi:O-antigen/teichoic acid export membrane protein